MPDAAVQSASTQAQRLSETSEHHSEGGHQSSDESDAGRQNHPSSTSPYSTEPQSPPSSEGLI